MAQGYVWAAPVPDPYTARPAAGPSRVLGHQLDSEPRNPLLPPDLAGGLADEPLALGIFNALTPALRRQIIRYVEQAKHASTREKRILLIAKRMKERAAKRKKKKK